MKSGVNSIYQKIVSISAVIMLFFLLYSQAEAYSAAANKHYYEGVEHLRNRRFEEAAKSFSQAVFTDPNYKEAWYEMGNAYYNLGQLEKALDGYYAALDVDPQYKKALIKTGQVFIKLKNYPMASFKMQEAAEIYPQDAEISFLLGQALERNGELEPALKQYKKTLALDKKRYGFLEEKVKKMGVSLSKTQESQIDSTSEADLKEEKIEDVTGTPVEEETAVNLDAPLPEELLDSSESPIQIKSPVMVLDSDEQAEDLTALDETETSLADSEDSIPAESDSSGDAKIISFIKTSSLILASLICLISGLYLGAEYRKNRRKQLLIRKALSKVSDMSCDETAVASKEEIYPEEPRIFDETYHKKDSPSLYEEDDSDETIPVKQESIKTEKPDEKPLLKDNPPIAEERTDASYKSYYNDMIDNNRIFQDETKKLDKPKRIINITFRQKDLQNNIPADTSSSISKKQKEVNVEEIKKEVKKPSPYICICGKIIRDNSLICPRCGRSSE